jgi:hypothetical protein
MHDSKCTNELAHRILKQEGNVIYLQPPHLVSSEDDDQTADSGTARCQGGVCTLNFKPQKPQRPAA